MSNPYLDKLLSLDPNWSLGYTFRTVGTDRIWDDDSGSAGDYDIVLNGGTERTSGGPTNDPDARWVYFDGSASDYGEAAEGITGLSNFTMAAWVRTPDRTQLAKTLFACFNTFDGDYRSWTLQFRGTGETSVGTRYAVVSSTNGSGVSLTAGGGGIPDNDTWDHIVITRSGSTVTPYRNGVPQTTATRSGTLFSTASAYFSVAATPGSDRRWDGDIYAPALWTSALTATEVEELYDAASEEPAGGSAVAKIMISMDQFSGGTLCVQ